MHDGIELAVILTVCVALLAGAAMRMLAAKLRVPHTVGMLLLGVAFGIGLQILGPDAESEGLLRFFARSDLLSPALIILIFVPALVFESGVSLDSYAFSKNLGQIMWLAVVAMLICVALTALLMVLLTAGSWEWSLTVALAFGALISATDPVAVVAILRDLGAPKRLSLLIDGESMLNDGTSIVAFSVLIGLATAASAAGISDGLDAAHVALEFVRVVGGGLLVGIALAAIFSFWISRVFNDPLVEISLTIALAYVAMIVAEAAFHVSGVVAVVVVAVWMAGPGRTTISPEVVQLQHKFWEILAHIANSLIFFLVGHLIAGQIHHATLVDAWLVPVAWLGVMAIRAGAIFACLPILNLLGEKITARDATVMAWGGMRGAVSLALALIVAHTPGLPEDVRHQMLRVTAGVVLLSILVNGTTTSWLMKKLGYDRIAPGDELAMLTAEETVLQRVARAVDHISRERAFHLVAWKAVKADLDSRLANLRNGIAARRAEIGDVDARSRAALAWRQAIGIERMAYQRAFAEGTLGATAIQILDLEIDWHLDRIAHGNFSVPHSRSGFARRLRLATFRWLRGLRLNPTSLQIRDLSLLSDLARAESLAARDVLDHLGDFATDTPDITREIRAAYEGFLTHSRGQLEDLRVNLPEIMQGIETRLARRIELNLEREEFARIHRQGIVDEEMTHAALAAIEARMKALKVGPIARRLPMVAELCRATPLFRSLDDAAISTLEAAITEDVLSPGDVLFREGDSGADVFVVARGAVHVLRGTPPNETLIDVLGGGDVIGEMALLSGEPRSATIRAATTVILGRIAKDALTRLMAEQPRLREQIFAAYARHVFDNFLREHPDWAGMLHAERMDWVTAGDVVEWAAGEVTPAPPDDRPFAFLIAGTIGSATDSAEAPLRAPRLFPASTLAHRPVLAPTTAVWLPEPPLPATPAHRHRDIR